MGRFGKGWGKVKMDGGGKPYVPESDIQKSCVRWFRTCWHLSAPFLFSIPNGAKIGGLVAKSGHPVAASILKAEGMTSGIPDLFLALPRCGCHGLFIEMKTPVGSLEPGQREYLELFALQGYAVALCRSLDEFEAVVNSYMNGEFVQSPVWAYKWEPKKKSTKVC